LLLLDGPHVKLALVLVRFVLTVADKFLSALHRSLLLHVLRHLVEFSGLSLELVKVDGLVNFFDLFKNAFFLKTVALLLR
jgi:hypothetical protein